MNATLMGVALGVACAFLHGCSLSTIGDYKPDANDNCIMEHTWSTTANSEGGPLYLCPGWYRERRILDAQPKRAVRK